MPRSSRQHDSEERAGLLVSVRDAGEAIIALDGGADFIDIKEPARGSLGPADPDSIAAIVAAIDERAPISLAAGELLEWSESVAPTLVTALQGTPALIKFGLAACGAVPNWPARLQAAISLLDDCRPVAVVYADRDAAAAPPPDDVFKAAVAMHWPAILVDTWDKSRGTLFDHWPADEVAAFCDRVHRSGMLAVLAGSLDTECLNVALRCGPDMIAVRGAVCDDARTGRIAKKRVETIRALIDRHHVGDKQLSSNAPYSL